jgi:hypothetical protein
MVVPVVPVRGARSVLPVLAVLLAAGCSGGKPATAAPACRQPAEAVLPQTAGTLTEADTGAFCLPVGGRIAVFLSAPTGAAAGSDHWGRVASSAPQVLAAAGTAVLTAPMGVTPGMFRGATAGEARLTSTTAAGKSWQVTIVVS